jgi:hypothetical protein
LTGIDPPPWHREEAKNRKSKQRLLDVRFTPEGRRA